MYSNDQKNWLYSLDLISLKIVDIQTLMVNADHIVIGVTSSIRSINLPGGPDLLRFRWVSNCFELVVRVTVYFSGENIQQYSSADRQHWTPEKTKCVIVFTPENCHRETRRSIRPFGILEMVRP